MPYFRSIQPIIDTAKSILEDNKRMTQTSSDLISIVQPLASKKAGNEVSRIVSEILGAERSAAPVGGGAAQSPAS
jgi:hypothetical protein